MRKKRWMGFLLVLLLAMRLVGVCAAGFEIHSVRIMGDGLLQAVLRNGSGSRSLSDYSAGTENGMLDVTDTKGWDRMGTSWFVILDYGAEIHTVSTPLLKQSQDRILNGISNLVGEADEGALVLCSAQPSIVVKENEQFRSDLCKSAVATDTVWLPLTTEHVMAYIREHREELQPNIYVILFSHGYDATASIRSGIETTLRNNSDISTHVISVAGSAKTYGSKPDGWRDRATQLSILGALTSGGGGFVTLDLSIMEADQAWQSVKDAMTGCMALTLCPQDAESLGRELTISQASGSAAHYTLSEEEYAAWRLYWPLAERAVKPAEAETTALPTQPFTDDWETKIPYTPVPTPESSVSPVPALTSTPMPTPEPTDLTGSEPTVWPIIPSTSVPDTRKENPFSSAVQYVPGDQILLTLQVLENPNKAVGAVIKLIYDHEVLILNANDQVRNDVFSLLNLNGIAPGEMIQLEFTVSDGARGGTQTVTAQALEAYDLEEKPVVGLMFSTETYLITALEN